MNSHPEQASFHTTEADRNAGERGRYRCVDRINARFLIHRIKPSAEHTAHVRFIEEEVIAAECRDSRSFSFERSAIGIDFAHIIRIRKHVVVEYPVIDRLGNPWLASGTAGGCP